jgi:hypothetical protein
MKSYKELVTLIRIFYPKLVSQSRIIIILLLLFIVNNCTIPFTPEVAEDQSLLVVEGLVTDQLAPNRVKLSTSRPLSETASSKPVTGCSVSISDDTGNTFNLSEKDNGVYETDSTVFRGAIGRTYTLHISRNNGSFNYESTPMQMIPVPPIDSIYYEKEVVTEAHEGWFGIDACQIFLDTHDPLHKTNYYRWTFSETWVLRLLFPVPNMTCYVSEETKKVNVKSTASMEEPKIIKHPINFISNLTDRLKVRYSILVKQYSINEQEFTYWDKANDFINQVGGLYDVIPSYIPNNLSRVGFPEEKVLGYFSVSAVSSKRIFIPGDLEGGDFKGIVDQYPNCIDDTIWGEYDPPALNLTEWVLIDHPAEEGPRMRVLSYRKECADCTTRGTTVKPEFWVDAK